MRSSSFYYSVYESIAGICIWNALLIYSILAARLGLRSDLGLPLRLRGYPPIFSVKLGRFWINPGGFNLSLCSQEPGEEVGASVVGREHDPPHSIDGIVSNSR